METIAAPWRELKGREVHGRYPLHKYLAEGDRQAVYETTYREKPAVIKLMRPDSSQTAYRLLASIDAGKTIRHPHLLEIFDSGDIRMDGIRYVYAVMERADDNLARVLKERTLEAGEIRELLPGCLSALEFLHAENLIHTAIKPSNVFAVGDTLKISSDSLHPASMPRGYAQAPGIHDAPETGSGIYVPASDLYSLAVLIRESATGTPTESGSEKIPAPFDAIVRGGTIKDPQQRWSIARIRAVLNGEAVPAEPAPAKVTEMPLKSALLNPGADKPASVSSPRRSEDEEAVPLYRKYRGVAIAGAAAATVICGLLVRSALHSRPASSHTERAAITDTARPEGAATAGSTSVEPEAPKPSPLVPSSLQPSGASSGRGKGWAVVAATYHRETDAEKRVRALKRHHNSLHPQVVSAGESKFLVVFGKGMNQQQAKTVEQKAKRSGAAPDAYVTLLELE